MYHVLVTIFLHTLYSLIYIRDDVCFLHLCLTCVFSFLSLCICFLLHTTCLCFTLDALMKNLHHRSENPHPKDVRQMWNQASKVSLWGGDLHPLCGSLQELLDIGNTIHWKHWNPSLALSPCPRHYPNKTFSHLGWLCFVAILSMLFEKGFPKWNQSIKVQIKISNH